MGKLRLGKIAFSVPIVAIGVIREILDLIGRWDAAQSFAVWIGLLEKSKPMNLQGIISGLPWYFPYVTSFFALVLLMLVWRDEIVSILKRKDDESFDVRSSNELKDLETYFDYRVSSGKDNKHTSFTLYIDPRTKKKRSDPSFTDWRKTYHVTARAFMI